VTIGDKRWHVSNAAATPMRVLQFERTLSRELELRLQPGEAKIRKRNQSGRQVECVTVKRQFESRELCFEQSTGAPASINISFGPWTRTYKYGDYVSFASVLFPRKLQYLEGNTMAVEIEIQQLAAEELQEASLFTPPPGATPTPTCSAEKVTPPERIDQVRPRYPEEAKMKRQTGIVSFTLTIGTDGVPRKIFLARSAGAALDAAAQTALEQFRYKPAMCGGVPFEIEDTVDIRFWLQ